MPAYTLLYPIVEIEFYGKAALLKEYYNSEFTVVRKVCRGKGDKEECHEQYLTVNYSNVPKELIATKQISLADKLQAITLYIAKYIKNGYVYTMKGFIDRKKPMDKIRIRVIEANAELKIYKGFRTEYYVINRNQTKFRVSVVPVFEFEITPTLSRILRENIDKGISHGSLLMELGDIDLSTVPEYWQRKIGPKDAGTFQEFYEPSHPEHKEKLRMIERYYKYEKKKRNVNDHRNYWQEIKSICPNIENDFIVSVEKYWKGKRTYNDYFGRLLLLTPNLETLSVLLEKQELDRIHSIMRPRPKKFGYPLKYWDYSKFYSLIRKTVEEYIEILRNIPLIKVRKNAIVE